MTRLWIKLWISGLTVCSVALGITIISIGNHRAAQDYYYNVLPWGFGGAFFIALPAIALAIVVAAAIARAAAAEHQRYRAWKASLKPEQRMAVELAEAAAATAAAIALWEHHKRVDARLTSSVMGRTLPDGRSPRPTQRIASHRQQAPLASGPGAQDPAGVSQALIARHHPGHLDPATGTYRSLPW